MTYATNDTSSPVTIILRKGPSNDLDTVATLTDSATNGQYIWTPSDSLVNGNGRIASAAQAAKRLTICFADYALEITQNGQTNYYGP